MAATARIDPAFQTLRDKVEFAIYTPGSNAGLPLSILRSLGVPSQEVLDSSEALRERVVR